MNWKKEATQRLTQYDAARCAVENLHLEISRLEEMIRSPGKALAQSGSSKSREDWLLDQLVLLDETRRRYAGTRSWLDVTDGALQALTREDQLVLHRLFIQPRKGGVEELCRELSTERSSVYRRREQALRNFTLALYGPD